MLMIAPAQPMWPVARHPTLCSCVLPVELGTFVKFVSATWGTPPFRFGSHYPVVHEPQSFIHGVKGLWRRIVHMPLFSRAPAHWRECKSLEEFLGEMCWGEWEGWEREWASMGCGSKVSEMSCRIEIRGFRGDHGRRLWGKIAMIILSARSSSVTAK